MKVAGEIIEGLLLLALVVDAVILVASFTASPNTYEPYGGLSFVLLLTLFGFVRWLRES